MMFRNLACAIIFLISIFANINGSKAQDLPPKLSPQVALDNFCNEWLGKKVKGRAVDRKICSEYFYESQRFVRSMPRFDDLSKEFVDGVSTVSVIIRKLEREAIKAINKATINCGKVKNNKDRFFSGLTKRVNCSIGIPRAVGIDSMQINFLFRDDLIVVGWNIEVVMPVLKFPGVQDTDIKMSSFNWALLAEIPANQELKVDLTSGHIGIKNFYFREPISSRSGKWIGYVIKVFDYATFKGIERKKRMIFPYMSTYPSKSICYEVFGKKFKNDPELVRLYPQTSNAAKSYLFGCIEN